MFESQTEMTIGQARQALICLEDDDHVQALAATLNRNGL